MGQEVILVFDVGNTHIVIGVYQGKKRLQHWRVHTDQQVTEDEYGIVMKSFLSSEGILKEHIIGIVISSVVPPVTSVLRHLSTKYFGISPLIVGENVEVGLSIQADYPTEVGADRIVNAISAMEQYGFPVVIVDFGTATTFCVVDESGSYVGGVISPGVQLSSEALYTAASKLTRVEIRKPRSVVGKNTTEAVQSGIYFGYVSLIEGMIDRIKRDMKIKPRVVATGGLAELICKDVQSIDEVNPFLTLEGLRLIFEKNQNRKMET